MTRAALTVLGADPDRPSPSSSRPATSISRLHKNNLDNAVGAVYSGEDAIQAIIDWVEANSNWDDSVLIVTADHGHYLVIDDPAALLGSGAKAN